MRRISTPAMLVLAGALAACQDGADVLAPPAAPVRAAAASPAADAIPGQYIVILNSTAPDVAAAAKDLLAAHGGRMRYLLEPAVHGFSAELSPQAAAALARTPNVRAVEPNLRFHAATTQTGVSWSLDRIDQRPLTGNNTFIYNATGAGVHAYVIDSGMRLTHTDFGGRASSGYDFVDSDTDASDCLGHGTNVAGVLGGSTWGVAKGVSLVSVRVLDCTGSGDSERITRGINWVIQNAVKPAVANLSLTTWSLSLTVDNAVRSLVSAGVPVVVSSGNGSVSANLTQTSACNYSPAHVTEAITVGASDISDHEAGFSDYGSCVDLLAPGVGITTDGNSSDTGADILDGTSLSAPQVAGAVAQYLQLYPTATPATVASAITSNATANALVLSSASASAGTPNRLLFTRFIGYGMGSSLAGPTHIGNGMTCSWSASVTGGTAPYSYAWSIYASNGGYLALSPSGSTVYGTGNYYGSYGGIGTTYLNVSITDANGVSVSSALLVNIATQYSICY